MAFIPRTGIPAWFPATTLAMAMAVAAAGADELPDLPPDLGGTPMPQVLTPARLAQAQVDVGASVTVIDHEMIAAMGVRDLPELLRLVPGMMVVRASGSEFSVNYHGTNLRDVRRIQVLVDGMSVYQPALAHIQWSDIALSIDDIDRIEVTRGPDAAAYGANAFSGVINVITIHPQESTRNMLRVDGGNRETTDGGGRAVGHGEHSDWRLSFSTKSDSGYDVNRYGAVFRDDRASTVVNWRSEYRPDAVDRIEVLAGAKDGSNEELANNTDIFTRYEEQPTTKTRNMDLMVRWNREIAPTHALQVQAYAQDSTFNTRWRACLDPILLSTPLANLSAINQNYAFGLLNLAASNPGGIPAFIASLPTAQAQQDAMATVQTYFAFQTAKPPYTQTCGNFDLDAREDRLDVEVQDTLRVNDRIRVVSGASFRRDSGSSHTYLGGSEGNNVFRLFSHGEVQLSEPLLLNVGAMFENDQLSGATTSPRAALNWRFLPDQSLRVVGSAAYRTQNIYEEYANTNLTMSQLAPAWPGGSTQRDFFLHQQASGDLEPEHIKSGELGWFAHVPEWRSDFDLRVFREQLDHLISQPINLFNFVADNNSTTWLNGAEWQGKYTPVPGTWFWATYAYIDNDSTAAIERKGTPHLSGSLAAAHRFPRRWEGSAAWYVDRDMNYTPTLGWKDFERLDLRLAHEVPLGKPVLTMSLNAQCRTDGKPEVFQDNLYTSRVYAWLGLMLTF